MDSAAKSTTLWDEEDGFYYDFLRRADGLRMPLKLRSLVGLLPIFPASRWTKTSWQTVREQCAELHEQHAVVRRTPPGVGESVPDATMADGSNIACFTLVPEDRLRRVLARMFDPDEFLSDYGIRSISRYYLEHPYELRTRDQDLDRYV